MRRVPPIALVVTCVVLGGLLPTPWIAAITGDLSSVLWIPLSPLSHGSTALRVWLRPGSGATPAADGSISEDRDYFRGLWHAERLRVAELERRLAEFQATAAADRASTPVRLVGADVLSRSQAAGGIALKVNAGKRQGISSGDVAVVGGDAIVGRVAPDVGEIGCFVVSISARGTPRIDSIIVPVSEERSRKPRTVAVQLSPDGSGVLIGDIDLGSPVSVGDAVRVADAAWPPGAQGMRVGRVIKVRRKEAQPLRGEVVVEPSVDASTIGALIIKVGEGQR
ncbi:MAG: hypothetical protein EXS03_00805 [Phycisphaerales bacterium]|nr:hypothetical protein [Phycisphaerales bacterium]